MALSAARWRGAVVDEAIARWVGVALLACLTACGGRSLGGTKRMDAGSDARDAPRDSGPDAPRDAAPDGDCVPLGSVVFRMEAPPIDGGYQYAYSLGDPGDGVWWYSLEAADGSLLPIFLPPGTFSTCGRCEPALEPIGRACTRVPDGGVARTWGGYTISGTSGCEIPATPSDPAHIQGCATIRCLPPGRYMVKMCAGRGKCPPDNDATCVEVPFDFPTDAEVVGHLPP